MRISVFTPTYNRAYIIGNLYSSLKRQSFCDFEWLIIDDGSDDHTEELVQHWIEEKAGFSIRYYKQENGGKCRAINYALDMAEGELFLVVDSDDYLTDDALEKIAAWESSLPEDERFCGVSGNLGTSETETTNRFFEGGFLDGTLLDRYGAADGERVIAFYTDIHRMYRYPVFDDEKFMTEAVAYNRMANDGFKMRFFNDIICVYEYLDDGLTKAGNNLFLQNPKGYGLWMYEKAKFMGSTGKRMLRLWYTFYCEMTFCDEQYRLTKKQCAECIKAPLWAMFVSAILHKLRQVTKRHDKKAI